MLVSSSEGFWREGLLAAILLRALMVAGFVVESFETIRKFSGARTKLCSRMGRVSPTALVHVLWQPII